MLAIQGIYNGNNFVTLEKFPSKKKYKVVITFIEEIDDDTDVRNFAAQTNSMDFWQNKEEDIYQDYLKK